MAVLVFYYGYCKAMLLSFVSQCVVLNHAAEFFFITVGSIELVWILDFK